MIEPSSFPQPVRHDVVAVMQREWDRLARPGATLTGGERIELAATVRSPVRSCDSATPEVDSRIAAAVRIAHEPATIDREFIDGLCDSGMRAAEYVEIIGLVSRLAAVDSFHRILGAEQPALPAAVDGEPSNDLNPMAQSGRSFVPMVRGASIIYALTLIPDEHEAMMDDFHDTLYLSTTQMQQPTSPRAITRPQIELLATLTSAENECFY